MFDQFDYDQETGMMTVYKDDRYYETQVAKGYSVAEASGVAEAIFESCSENDWEDMNDLGD